MDNGEAFLRLEPWRWINGTSLFGVRDVQSGEVDWCSIMGQAGQTFGVAIYAGEAGLGSLQRMLDDGPDEFDAIIQQQALVFTCNDRDMITKDMAAVLKGCGRRYRGRNAWPELVEHLPGYFPMPPQDPVRLRRTAMTLACLTALCAEALEKPGLDLPDEQDRNWVAYPEANGRLSVTREAIPLIPRPTLPVLAIDEVAVARARAQARQVGSTILLDWFVGNAVIDGSDADGRPYFVTHVMALDPQTGIILGMEMGRLAEVWQDTARLLLTTCAAYGVPTQVLLRRREAMTVLGPLITVLGAEPVHRPEAAEATRHIRDELEGFGR